MANFKMYNWITQKAQYKNFSNFNILKPLIIWANANTMLDEFYSLPEINLSATKEDNEIRNTMRHIVGVGIAGSQYGIMAYPIGAIKEILDFLKDILLHKPIGKLSREVWKASSVHYNAHYTLFA